MNCLQQESIFLEFGRRWPRIKISLPYIRGGGGEGCDIFEADQASDPKKIHPAINGFIAKLASAEAGLATSGLHPGK